MHLDKTNRSKVQRSCRPAEVKMEDKEMRKKVCALWQNEEGQGLVEYSLIAALVAVAVVAALTLLGGGIQNTLNTVVAAL